MLQWVTPEMCLLVVPTVLNEFRALPGKSIAILEICGTKAAVAGFVFCLK